MNDSVGFDGLAAHGARVADELDHLGLPPKEWLPPHDGPDGAEMLDVLVVGAGMCGIAAAAALRFKGIHRVRLLDQSAGGQEGPWVTTARMRTLRSPKHLPGIALGMPSLTFRAYYTARFGRPAWDALYKIGNGDWQAYLSWVAHMLRLPVASGTAAVRVLARGPHLAVEMADGGILHARRVVLATGRAALGGWSIPAGIDRALWPDRAAHTGERIDVVALAGRRVAVVGAGASGWDAAGAALEAGAARVDMHCRRAVLPQVNKGRGSTNPGYHEGWASLSAAQRWSLLTYLHDVQGPPPHESVLRCTAHPNFRLHLASAVRAASRTADGIALDLSGGPAAADFLICATGYRVDLGAAPLLSALAPQIATWPDAYTPPPAERRPSLGGFPFLAENFAATERFPGRCPALAHLHLFSHAAMASLGAIASDIPGVSTAAERLSGRIAASLFAEDFTAIRTALEAFAEPELESTPFFAL
jgi:cation diffusion facilitator CzcD-associated flavoprotein CzcO